MADNTTTTEETPYESPEMTDIKARIAEQDAIIDAAREELKQLRNARRRQARVDAKEAERLAREREQVAALEFWRTLHDCDIRQNDGSTENAYEFITRKVMPHIVAGEARQTSDGVDSAHVIEEPLAATMSTCADSTSSDGC